MKTDATLTSKQMEAFNTIRNWLAHEQRMPTVRELMVTLGYKSPRSAQDILEQLIVQGIIEKREKGNYRLVMKQDWDAASERTVDVPIVGLVAAGSPVLAQEIAEAVIPISSSLAKPGSKYFLLRVSGDSMNEADINDGDLVLVRQQSVAENGQRVVALIDGEATIKEYRREKDVVVLKPKSANKKHKPIVMTIDFQIQGVVVATIPKLE